MKLLSAKKGHAQGPLFALKPRSLAQPGLDRGRAVFSFPVSQRLVTAAFCFDYCTGVWVFTNLNLALAAAGLDSTAGERRRPTCGSSRSITYFIWRLHPYRATDIGLGNMLFSRIETNRESPCTPHAPC